MTEIIKESKEEYLQGELMDCLSDFGVYDRTELSDHTRLINHYRIHQAWKELSDLGYDITIVIKNTKEANSQ